MAAVSQPETKSYDSIPKENREKKHSGMKVFIHIVCIFLSILSVVPFWIMIVNSTRSTTQIHQHALSLIPSTYFVNNFKILTGGSFNPMVGLMTHS